jgi:membrane fusion protein (multidrug efflux system)
MSTTSSPVIRVPETMPANGTSAPGPAPAEPAVALAAGRNKGRRPYFMLGIAVCLVVGGYALFHLLAAGRENTDDAQVGTDMVPIAARVGGLVLEVPVNDHAAVKTGDLIARLDPADYEAKVLQADADLRAARAQADAADAQMRIVAASSRGGLSSARAALSGSAASVAGADAQIEAAKAALAHAEADAHKADVDLKRAESLGKVDAIPHAQVESMASAAAVANAAVAQARAQLVAAEEGKRLAQARIGEAAGRVEQSTPVDAQLAVVKANADLAHARIAAAEAQLAQARLNLSYTQVRAPRDGHISKLGVHAGQLVVASQTVTNLLPTETYVVANFKETQVGQMRPGQRAEISVDALHGRTFHGKVESVAHGTGAQFSLLPPDNASGNFVKVVQRVPVKLVWSDVPPGLTLEAGLSADVTVFVN